MLITMVMAAPSKQNRQIQIAEIVEDMWLLPRSLLPVLG